jgi:ATP-dependent Clp protease protease subunit
MLKEKVIKKRSYEDDSLLFPLLPPPIPKARIIQISGLIDEELHQRVVADLVNFEQENKDPIFLHINSYGGYVYEMLGILDIVRSSQCKIITVCTGKAMSAAVPILASGLKGERKIGKYSTIMLHEVSSFTYGKLFELKNETEETERLQKLYIDILGNLTGKSSKVFQQIYDTHRDTYLTPKEVIKLGIADKIL